MIREWEDAADDDTSPPCGVDGGSLCPEVDFKFIHWDIRNFAGGITPQAPRMSVGRQEEPRKDSLLCSRRSECGGVCGDVCVSTRDWTGRIFLVLPKKTESRGGICDLLWDREMKDERMDGWMELQRRRGTRETCVGAGLLPRVSFFNGDRGIEARTQASKLSQEPL